MEILVFAAGLWLTSLIPGADLLAWVIGVVLSFVAAVFLPSLLFGRPSLVLSWQIEGNDFSEGWAFVDLTKPNPLFNGPEIAFKVDLVAEYRSLAGLINMRRMVKHGWVACVEFGPPGIVNVKEQRPGAAKVISINGAPAIQLPLTKARHGWKQARMIGSFQPVGIVNGRDTVQFALTLRDPPNRFHPRQAAMTSGINGLDVRS
ncbi:hypothetical protein [Leifsonia aquatica]|uniref:Uncharacterized protein n=2 Tax=Leifsonia aquatica TaxID=144185 RepID=U2TFT9_LEIAQ|nr:hypothetical protein [Leifsonia aquatica]ERK73557.1 hypothetical protein N136_00115 [Leifsonia aquatica ATCC 14665]MBB2968005.1 hypothetical protein [Leifsonia aquatica]